MDYSTLKTLHITLALLTFISFFARGLLMLTGSPVLRRRWLRIAPHIVDTLLLLSALALSLLLHQYPFVQPWLTAKVFALLVYIGLGMVAFRFGKTMPVRVASWLAALLVFAYIVAVAITRNPLPGIAA